MPQDTMQTAKGTKSLAPAMFKAMSAALKPTEKSLKEQKVLLTHLARNSYHQKRSAEQAMEEGRAAKKAADNEEKQTTFLQRLIGRFKEKPKPAEKGFVGFLKNNWGKLLLALLAFNKLWNTSIYDTVETMKKVWTWFDELDWKAKGVLIAGGIVSALTLPSAITKIGTEIASSILKYMFTKKMINNAIDRAKGPGGVITGSGSGKPTTTKPPTTKPQRVGGSILPVGWGKNVPEKIPDKPSMFGKAGKMLRITGGLVGKVALPAGAAFALFDAKDTFSEEGFKKGMAHAVESFTLGILPREASEKIFNTVEDGVKAGASAVTKGFVAAGNEIKDGWAALGRGIDKIKNYNYNSLLDPIRKQLAATKKAVEERLKPPSAPGKPEDYTDHAQLEAYRKRIEGTQAEIARTEKERNDLAKSSSTPSAVKRLSVLQKRINSLKKSLHKDQTDLNDFLQGGATVQRTGTRLGGMQVISPTIPGGTTRRNQLMHLADGRADWSGWAGLNDTTKLSSQRLSNLLGGLTITSGQRSKDRQIEAMMVKKDLGVYSKYLKNADKKFLNTKAGTPERRAAIEYIMNHGFQSSHLHGNAIDFSIPKGFTGPGGFQKLRNLVETHFPGSNLIDEGNHAHLSFNNANVDPAKLQALVGPADKTNILNSRGQQFNNNKNGSGAPVNVAQNITNNNVGGGGGTVVGMGESNAKDNNNNELNNALG